MKKFNEWLEEGDQVQGGAMRTDWREVVAYLKDKIKNSIEKDAVIRRYRMEVGYDKLVDGTIAQALEDLAEFYQ